MQNRKINAELAPQPASAYSQAYEVSGSTRTLYISGQLSIDADGTTPPDMAAQAALPGAISGRNSRPQTWDSRIWSG